MGIIDIFKRKKTKAAKVKKTETAETKTQQIKSEQGQEVEKKKTETKARPSTTKKVREEKIGKAYRILKIPQVTEKATDLTKKNQYVFRVFPKANKTEIKKAINELYGVDVSGVKIVKVPAKRRRLGRISGWRKGYKKAIVEVREGQKIEVLPR